jgi:ADP-ribose pyrophosphatase YjhB (NUDIX family)
MDGDGPFLWLNPYGPARGFQRMPVGGMCVSVFLFVERDGKVLAGKYQPHPGWVEMAGLDESRVTRDAGRWTLPARQLKMGEDPRDAARQIGTEILGIEDIEYGEPRVETDWWVLGEDAWGPPERKKMHHFDIWFFVDGKLPAGVQPQAPPWYSQVGWVDPATADSATWGRLHEDVVERWRQNR